MLRSYVAGPRDKVAAFRFMKKALKRHGLPDANTTDGQRSYGADTGELGCLERQEIGRWASNPGGEKPSAVTGATRIKRSAARIRLTAPLR